MGNVEYCGRKLLMKFDQFSTHGNTQLRVKVAERFVKEKKFWLSDDCASHGNPLPLTAGEGLRSSVKEIGQAQSGGGLFNAALYLRFF